MFFVSHKFAIASIPVLFVGLIFGAFALRLSLINNGSRHRIADGWWCGVTILNLIFCGSLLRTEISSSGNESVSPSPPNPAESKSFEIANNLSTNVSPAVNSSVTAKRPILILDEINSAMPSEQDAIANSFKGAKVRWILHLDSIKSIDKHDTVAIFTDGNLNPTVREMSEGNEIAVVICDKISDEDKNLLLFSEKGALFYVSGTISDCGSIGLSLANCKLESYSGDTHLK
jgi:hypothetical protein